MKQIILALMLIISLTSCQHKKRRKYVSVLKTDKSLINQWYGKDHFTENNDLDQDTSLNKNDAQDSFESDAGEMFIAPQSPSSTSSSQSPSVKSYSTQPVNMQPSGSQSSVQSSNTTSANQSTSTLTTEETSPQEPHENISLSTKEEVEDKDISAQVSPEEEPLQPGKSMEVISLSGEEEAKSHDIADDEKTTSPSLQNEA